WLQSYLDLSNDRATWAYIADALIAKHVPRAYENIDEMSKINIFLQSWKTNKKDLPKDLREMITTAKKHGLRLEGLAFSREIQRQMPIWFHSKATGMSRKHNQKLAKCLQQNHNVRTVGDAETLSKMNRTNRHTNRRNCRCTACTYIREQTNCDCPYKCYGKARELLDTLPHKWNPLKKQPEDYENEERDNEVDENSHKFDHKLTTNGSLSNAFRIFIEGEECNEILLQEWSNIDERGPVVVYTDGSCMNNESDEASAGSGVHFPNGDYEDRAIRLPSEMRQTNQTGEIIAI
ncbi:hypothetical protein C8R42DRAFT_540193, partial [Lentinula raphanica]